MYKVGFLECSVEYLILFFNAKMFQNVFEIMKIQRLSNKVEVKNLSGIIYFNHVSNSRPFVTVHKIQYHYVKLMWYCYNYIEVRTFIHDLIIVIYLHFKVCDIEREIFTSNINLLTSHFSDIHFAMD